MKVVLALVVVALLSLCNIAAAEQVVNPVSILSANGPIVVSGRADSAGWDNATSFTLEAPEALILGEPVDEQDCSLTAMLTHDDSSLFVFLKAIDQNIMSGDVTDWTTGDAVLIGWNRNGRFSSLDQNDKLIVVRPLSITGQVVSLLDGKTFDFLAQTSAVDGAWQAEFAVPFSALGGMPDDGKRIGFAMSFWDMDEGSFGPNVLSNSSNGALMAAGSPAWQIARFYNTAPEPTATDMKDIMSGKIADGQKVHLDTMNWTVTKAEDGSFYCEAPSNRLDRVKVIWPNSLVEKAGVASITGTLKINGPEKMIIADSADVTNIPAFELPGAFAMNSRAIGQLNMGLRVRIAGTVESVNQDSFIINDGGQAVRIIGNSPEATIGQTIVITGVVSYDGDQPIILMTEIQ